MANLDVAGLLAYLLSIYPSVTFDPSLDTLVPAPISDVSAAVTNTLYTAIHAGLPTWVASFLPKPQAILSATAPIPISLTPAQLKAALLGLSSKDLLTDIPAKTVNLLVFNNATTLK